LATKREVSWIFDGGNAHTNIHPEISEHDIFHAHKIQFSTYSNNKDYLVLPFLVSHNLYFFLINSTASSSARKHLTHLDNFLFVTSWTVKNIFLLRNRAGDYITVRNAFMQNRCTSVVGMRDGALVVAFGVNNDGSFSLVPLLLESFEFKQMGLYIFEFVLNYEEIVHDIQKEN
jgi:hypothetical protein